MRGGAVPRSGAVRECSARVGAGLWGLRRVRARRARPARAAERAADRAVAAEGGGVRVPAEQGGPGYFPDVDCDRADGEFLPQLEDPGDRLRPSRFFVRSPLA